MDFYYSFSSSNHREDFFKRLFELAVTQEQLFFIVTRVSTYSFWPKAVRRLAQLKDLSPFESKR
jgi:arabinogalactan endo-1,4-beta-galactosidase